MRSSTSLEWEAFWALIGIICVLFFIVIFTVVLWIVRKHLFADSIVKKQRKCWEPKLLQLISAMKSNSRTTHIDDDNDATIQRAVCCEPNILQNNESGVKKII